MEYRKLSFVENVKKSTNLKKYVLPKNHFTNLNKANKKSLSSTECRTYANEESDHDNSRNRKRNAKMY